MASAVAAAVNDRRGQSADDAPAFVADRHRPPAPRRSDASCAEEEIGLKPGKGAQESDQHILDPHGALRVLFQATEVSQDQRLATEGVRQTIAPDHFALSSAAPTFEA